MRVPREIKRLGGDGVRILWSDGREVVVESRTLRERCPCATCRERRGDGTHAKPLSTPKKRSMLKIVEASVEEELRLDQIWMVGQYAIGLRWGDGHDTGIYTFDYLYELCQRSSGVAVDGSDTAGV